MKRIAAAISIISERIQLGHTHPSLSKSNLSIFIWLNSSKSWIRFGQANRYLRHTDRSPNPASEWRSLSNLETAYNNSSRMSISSLLPPTDSKTDASSVRQRRPLKASVSLLNSFFSSDESFFFRPSKPSRSPNPIFNLTILLSTTRPVITAVHD